MKRVIALLALVTSGVHAAPFLYGDVEPTVTSCGMVLDAAPKVTAPIVSVGGVNQCKFDLATIKPGSHTATLTAILIDPVWGNQESAPSAPFPFTRPATPSVPTTPRLGQ